MVCSSASGHAESTVDRCGVLSHASEIYDTHAQLENNVMPALKLRALR